MKSKEEIIAELEKEVDKWSTAYETCHNERMIMNSEFIAKIKTLEGLLEKKEAMLKQALHANKAFKEKLEIAIDALKHIEKTFTSHVALKALEQLNQTKTNNDNSSSSN